MNLGVTLKAAEKVFGPALPGRGAEENTLAAVRYAKGRAKKYAGIPGVHDEAKFYIHFPTPVDWSLLITKKGTPDFVSDLTESGPQGEQGREALAAQFLKKRESVREKLRQKREKAETAARAKQLKQELTEVRQRLIPFQGERNATLNLDNESVTIPIKITVDKSGKIKISATI